MSESSINHQNIQADQRTYGKWAVINEEYFGRKDVIEYLYNVFIGVSPQLPKSIDIVDFGSAEGLVGEFFKNKLSHSHEVSLTLIDAVKEHLDANVNSTTIKIQENLLKLSITDLYDVGIMRSVLHYFSADEQVKVLKNIYNSIKNEGYFIVQAFVQNISDLELFLELNNGVSRKLQLISESKLIELIKDSGFSEASFIGDAPTWDCTSDNLSKRYSLSSEDITRMRQMILDAPEDKRRGFKVTSDGFTVPVPYKVILARKLS